MVEENSIDTRVKQVIVEHLGVEGSMVINDASLVGDLGVDSLDALDLLLAMNEEFGTRIVAEKLPEIHTVQQFIDIVKAELP